MVSAPPTGQNAPIERILPTDQLASSNILSGPDSLVSSLQTKQKQKQNKNVTLVKNLVEAFLPGSDDSSQVAC
jgi:hypothetical protein